MKGNSTDTQAFQLKQKSTVRNESNALARSSNTQWINVCISMKLCYIVTKIGTGICLYTPYKCGKFSQIGICACNLRADFVICTKKEKKTLKLWLLVSWKQLMQFTANSCHILWSSDKRSQIYKCMKITSLLLLLIYSLPFMCAQGSWAAWTVVLIAI